MRKVNQSDSKAAALHDRRFYKYMSRSTAAIVLRNHTLRWSRPGSLNDPFDGQFDLRTDKIDREQVIRDVRNGLWELYSSGGAGAPVNAVSAMISRLRRQTAGISRGEFERHLSPAIREGLDRGERALPHFQEELRPMIARSKILCLTESVSSPPMWAHYAEGNRGLVARFRSVSGLDSPWRMARPVAYLEDVPQLIDADSVIKLMSGQAKFDVAQIMKKMIFTKSIDWKYEREWRLHVGMGRNRNTKFEDIAFNTLELDAIVLGLRMPPDDRAMFIRTTQREYPHADILEIRKRKGEIRFDISAIEK